MLGSEIYVLIARIRRAMPRNADVMVLCDELEGRVVTAVVTPVTPVVTMVTRNQPPKRDRAAYMRGYRARKR